MRGRECGGDEGLITTPSRDSSFDWSPRTLSLLNQFSTTETVRIFICSMSSNDAPGLQRPPTTVAVCFYNIPQLTDAEFRSQFKVPCDLTRLVILKKLTHVRTQATVFTAKLRSCDRALAEAYVQEIQNLAFQSGVSVYVQYEEEDIFSPENTLHFKELPPNVKFGDILPGLARWAPILSFGADSTGVYITFRVRPDTDDLKNFGTVIDKDCRLELLSSVVPSIPRREIDVCKQGLEIDWKMWPRSFDFVFGNGKVISVPILMAVFLSEKVMKLHRSDICCKRYVMKSEYAASEEGYKVFEMLVEAIVQWEPLSILTTQLQVLVDIAVEIENTRILEECLMGDWSQADMKQMVDTLISVVKNGVYCFSQDCEIFSSLSHRFGYLLESPDIDRVPLDIVAMLLRNEHLGLISEDQLVLYILRRAKDNEAFLCLLEFVIFSYVSQDVMREVREVVAKSFDALNGETLRQILVRVFDAHTASPSPEKVASIE